MRKIRIRKQLMMMMISSSVSNEMKKLRFNLWEFKLLCGLMQEHFQY